ncbi:hypothetical protein DFP93_109116 [Aneurinibacillus soli]|uniref:Uncharacterized protein n=1 Tax=Aneurinibacillus soli TaxID=1500254 RepID=A0A0U5BA01_9BACL|nr:hypothetical protein [Aneurinibacillus soli]PYE61415.1 hypothetical protein DFP93_109116 [Aneurinibacillus soli]BAU27756.1 hypothetical protein CB4_01930 [Aneurinibacillus soli]
MEQKIERYIDNALDSIAPQLFGANIILGIILIFLGIIFIVKKSSKRNLKTVGLVCAGVGAVAIVSGLIQI